MLTRIIGCLPAGARHCWPARCVVIARYHEDHGVYGYRPSAWMQNCTAETSVCPDVQRNRVHSAALVQLVEAYRYYGHKKAKVDALDMQRPKPTPELDPAHYGLSSSEPQTFDLTGYMRWRLTC